MVFTNEPIIPKPKVPKKGSKPRKGKTLRPRKGGSPINKAFSSPRGGKGGSSRSKKDERRPATTSASRFYGNLQWGKGVEPNARVRVYWRDGKPILRNKHQSYVKGNPVSDPINMYYANGGEMKIEYVYKEKSSAIYATENLIGVRFAPDENGVKHRGWINRYGDMVTERQLRTFFKAVDQTSFSKMYAGDNPFTGKEGMQGYLTTLHDMMTPKMKMKLAAMYMAMDVQRFWDEFYPQDDSTYSNNEDMYRNIVEMFREAAGGTDQLNRLVARKARDYTDGTMQLI